ncbi:2OG-Fe dioxygenase family protein [Streptomyces sp. NPDC047928]|uniref:2OG-Fe dioxygenase family protein n=1 Tax=unclassified Streptomyces TaxID=2593676 RepID=UPI00371D1E29
MGDVIGSDGTARVGPVEAAMRDLITEGAHVMRPDAVGGYVGTGPGGWARFAAHWEELTPDPYAEESGTRRLRRYGHFTYTAGAAELVPEEHETFVQPEDSNPMYVGVDRHFDPLTDAFAADPLLTSLVELLGEVATCLDGTEAWSVKVHPFRVIASAGSTGNPTPEGRHRDGVTLVSSLLVDRSNADGGESSVFEPDGTMVLTTVLDEPGTLLLGDDRRTLHEVSPIRPVHTDRPARRDVLVVTLTPAPA